MRSLAGAALIDDVTLSTEGTAFEGNALRSLRVLRDDADVHLALEGDLTSGNAMLVYSGFRARSAARPDLAGRYDEPGASFVWRNPRKERR